VISIANFVAGVAMVVASPAAGYAIDRLGLVTALIATAGVLLGLSLLAYAAWWGAGDHEAEPFARPV